MDRHRLWHRSKSLDLQAMREAAARLVGLHDFSSFESSPTENTNPLCRLDRLTIYREGDLIRIEVYADRFLRQMVRAIVGTLVEVGAGKRSADKLAAVLEARTRSAAGRTAPPHGLYLVRVDY